MSGTKVYIDGVLEAANTDGGDGVNPTTDVYLGAREDLSSTRFFDGRLDSVRVYDRILELEQIAGSSHNSRVAGRHGRIDGGRPPHGRR